MSNCIITIRIGDQIITLDPNSNITPGSKEFLVNSLDVAKIRALYSGLRGVDNITFDNIPQADPVIAREGETLYESIADEANSKGEFISPSAALKQETDPTKRAQLAAYISTLDSTQILKSGNFLADMRNAYMLSPYSKEDIKNLVFASSNRHQSIYNYFTNAPGMEGLRISIANANEVNGIPVTTPTGRYIRPDNIIQIIVPDEYYRHGVDGDKVTKNNLDPKSLKLIRGTIIHELAHAIYSEVFISDPIFRKSMKALHDNFVKFYKDSTVPMEQSMVGIYGNDIHEFVSDIFDSVPLRNALTKMVSVDSIYNVVGGKFYEFLINSLPTSYRDADSAFKDALAISAEVLPTGILKDTFEKRMEDYVDPSDKRNLFFFNEGIDVEGIQRHITPKDQTNSYWTENAKAYRMQKAYLERATYNEATQTQALKDAYYKEPIEDPTQAQIDQLYAQDLVLIPWVRFNKLGDARGEWIERGAVVKKNGSPVLEDGKPKVVDITRDKAGKIIQDDTEGTIEERFKHVPVMYTNIKASKVVVAKVGLSEEANAPEYAGYNTLSFPYSFIRGIRKYDWNYFDHTLDYEADLAEAKAALAASNNDKAGIEGRDDRTSQFKEQITLSEKNIARANQVKEDLIKLHEDYAFNLKVEEGDRVDYFKNISEEDYLKTNWSTKNISNTTFASPEDAIFIAEKRGTTYFATPNPAKFLTLWQADSGSSFAKTSQNMSEVITKGDMIRIHTNETQVDEKGEKTILEKHQWLPVYQRVANGVKVGTPNGKGLIVRFNNIDAYAKNKTTGAWDELVKKYDKAIDSFLDGAYVDPTKKYGKMNAEVIKRRSAQWNEDYHKREDETEEESITRFMNNMSLTVTPGETFVKVKRKFVPSDKTQKKPVERWVNELIIAKDETGLTTLRRTRAGEIAVDHIAFTDTVTEHENYGKELMFTMENLGDVKEMWDEYTSEKAMFEENYEKPAWINEGTDAKPVMKAAFDFKDNPRGFRDWYDMYEDPNGVKVGRLAKGDIIGIKRDNSKGGKPYYFRKVIRVMEDGRVVVADYRAEDYTFPSGGIGKQGLYSRMVEMKDISLIGYKIGKVEGNKDDGFTSQFHQDIIDRRNKLMEYADKDKDYNDFKFGTEKQAMAFNKTVKVTDGRYQMYVPFTNKIVEPKTTEPEVFLDRDLENTTESKKTYVMAWMQGGEIINAERGIKANTKLFKAKDIVIKQGDKSVIHPIILEDLMTGDWVMKPYINENGKKVQAAYAIDRIEGGNVWVIAGDRTTFKINPETISGIRTSVRNDRMFNSKYKRYQRSNMMWKNLQAAAKPKASLDIEWKSPRASRRALLEIGNRMQTLNPDIRLNFIDQTDVNSISKQVDFDYSNVRAFVKDGEVYINTDRASISDVVHEYSHLFLHNLRYENSELYDALISGAESHPLYDSIAKVYTHLDNKQDTNEEVFVTLVGEYMTGRMNEFNTSKMEVNKDNMLKFSEYTKDKLMAVLGDGKSDMNDIRVEDVLTMRLEDIVSMVGDYVMNNRISSRYESPELPFSRDVESLKRSLKERGLLIEECYG